MNKRRLTTVNLLLALLALVLLLFPMVTDSSFVFHLITMVFIVAPVAMSLRLLSYVGLLSMAHQSFMAIGAYTTVILVKELGVSFWLALPAAGIAAVIVALIIGAPVLRLKGAYFFLVTFGFGEVARLLFSYVPVFGGFNGIWGFDRPTLGPVDFSAPIPYYYLALFFVVVAVYAMYRIHRSEFAMRAQAIRQCDFLAEALGVNLTRYRVILFATSCLFAGLGGALYSYYIEYINPTTFGFTMSLYLLMYVVIGGIAPFVGPIVGVVILRMLSTVIGGMPMLEPVIFGAILLIMVTVLPKGVVPAVGDLVPAVRKVVKRRRVYSEQPAVGSEGSN